MFENLYEIRAMIGGEIADILRDIGYTKVSFARMLRVPESKVKEMLAGNMEFKKNF